MNNDLTVSTSKSKYWDWDTLSWYNPQNNTKKWHTVPYEQQNELLCQVKQIYYPFFVKQGAKDWGIKITDNTVHIARSDLYFIWLATKNMAQVNKVFYSQFKNQYPQFMANMYEHNKNISDVFVLDIYFQNSICNHQYTVLLFDMLAYRTINENNQLHTFNLDNGYVFESPCIEHNLYISPKQQPNLDDSLLAKKLVYLSNKIRFFYNDSVIYSCTYDNSMSKKFIEECLKNGYLPIKTEYFANCSSKKFMFCDIFILLPVDMQYTSLPDGKLVKKLRLPFAYNNSIKVENESLHAQCDSLTFKNKLLQDRLDLVLPLLSGLQYFNDSVKQALAKLASYPLQESIQAKNTEKNLNKKLEETKLEHAITLNRFKNVLDEQNNIIEQLKKNYIKKDNKIESDIKIIKAYATANMRLLKEKDILRLQLNYYERQINKLQEQLAIVQSQNDQYISNQKQYEEKLNRSVLENKNHAEKNAELQEKIIALNKAQEKINAELQEKINALTKAQEKINALTKAQEQKNAELQETIIALTKAQEKINALTKAQEKIIENNALQIKNLQANHETSVQDLGQKHTTTKQKLYCIIAGSALLNIALLCILWQSMRSWQTV
ncbi:hypothetical protein EKK58_04050 [Candidatus Dependentiae bacterium]|nr:MAG: hypothetical protein EKK58_04050 [Candidatus Dependentiae bacterium]